MNSSNLAHKSYHNGNSKRKRFNKKFLKITIPRRMNFNEDPDEIKAPLPVSKSYVERIFEAALINNN